MSKFGPRIGVSSSWSEIVELATHKVAESQTLEFKRELPNKKDPLAEYTMRRDAVAMANGGGGLLLYGVEELQGRAEKVVPLVAALDCSVRLRDLLAVNIDPPLRPEVFLIADASGDAVVGVRVEGGPPRALVTGKEKSPEYWVRRDTSVRPFSPMELAHAFGTGRARIDEQLAPLAIWELRRIPRPIGAVFGFDDEREFSKYFDQTERLLEQSGDSALVLEEMGSQWEMVFTDAVRFGGYLRNYRLAADRFFSLLRPGIREPRDGQESDATRAAWSSFQRVLDLGFAYSYEANRRLQSAELLIALGAELLGEAILFAKSMRAPAAIQQALDRLDDQAQYYSGPLSECFAFARLRGLWDGDIFTASPPSLAVQAREQDVRISRRH